MQLASEAKTLPITIYSMVITVLISMWIANTLPYAAGHVSLQSMKQEEVVVVERVIKSPSFAEAPIKALLQPAKTLLMFEPDLSLRLSPELQHHTYIVSIEYNVPFEVLMAIMDHESRMIEDVPDNINKNGSTDRGLCQINSINWEWLMEDHGLDVSNPYDNIESAAVLLSGFLAKYDLETALACYAVGETGMQNDWGKWFPERIIPALPQYTL